MDPLSITAGVLALLTASIKVGSALRDFHGGVAVVEAKIKGLLLDVESFTKVLRNIKGTLDQEKVQRSLQATGHIGNHYRDLSTSIQDSQATLLLLQVTIDKANKSVKLLDGPRKHIRIQGAADEILVHHMHIRSCRDTLHLSLQAITLWNQIESQETNDKILATLDGVQQTIYTLATNLNAQIASLQNTVESSARNDEIRTLTNSRKCVQSAATVVSSATTALGLGDLDQAAGHGSDFGDLFPTEHNEAMDRWISSNTVYEFDPELEGTQTGTKNEGTLVEDSQSSDSESELETEIVGSFKTQGVKAYSQKDFLEAERLFLSCLNRLGKSKSTRHGHNRNQSLKTDITRLLVDTYIVQEKYDEGQALLMDKLAHAARGSTTDKQAFFSDMLELTKILYQKFEYKEAHLYGRKVLKGCRKLGPSGYENVNAVLKVLILICRAEESFEEEEAYTVILSNSLARKPALDEPVSTSSPSPIPLKEGLDDSSAPRSFPIRTPVIEDSRIFNEGSASMTRLTSNLAPYPDADFIEETVPIVRTSEAITEDASIPRNLQPSDYPEHECDYGNQSLGFGFGPSQFQTNLTYSPAAHPPTTELRHERTWVEKQRGASATTTASSSSAHQPTSLGSHSPLPATPSNRQYNPASSQSRDWDPYYNQPPANASPSSALGPSRWPISNGVYQQTQPQQYYSPTPTSATVTNNQATTLNRASPVLPPPNYIQVLVMGGPGVGKSSLIDAIDERPFSACTHPQNRAPVFSNVWGIDGNGQSRFSIQLVEARRGPIRHIYPFPSIILMCFSVIDNNSLEIIAQIASEAQQEYPILPILLIGLGEDLFLGQLIPFDEPSRTKAVKAQRNKAAEMERRIGANFYWQCSAKTGKGIDVLSSVAVSTAKNGKRSKSNGWVDKMSMKMDVKIDTSRFVKKVEEYAREENFKHTGGTTGY